MKFLTSHTLAQMALTLSSLAFFGGCASQPLNREMGVTMEWARNVAMQENLGYRHSERASPVYDADMVYAGAGTFGVAAFRRESGHEVWRFPIKQGMESGFAQDADHLYFGASDGQFYCLNKADGKVVWTFPTRAENLATPLLADNKIYFLSGNNVFYALDAKSGKQLWHYNRGDSSSLSVRGGAKPALFDGVLYEGFADGFLVAINSKDGSVTWERKLTTQLKFTDVDASPIVDEKNIWVSTYDGALFCLTRSDGQVVWRLEQGGAVATLVSGSVLYYASLDQTLYALEKGSGTVKWKYTFPEHEGVPTQPVLDGEVLLFGASDGDLHAVSALTGRELATFRTGHGIFATPAVDHEKGIAYVLSNQGYLYAFHLAWLHPEDQRAWSW